MNECMKATYLSTELQRLWVSIFGGLTSGEKKALQCVREVSAETHENYEVKKEIEIMSECDVYACGGNSIEYYRVVKGTQKSR